MCQRNDLCWDAIEPALRLAAKVLDAEPPYWKAILDIYTLRPVDRKRVPRDLREQEDRNLDVSSLWTEIDPDEMWPEARALYDTKPRFDAIRLTRHLLEKWVYFTVARGKFNNANVYVGFPFCVWATGTRPLTSLPSCHIPVADNGKSQRA